MMRKVLALSLLFLSSVSLPAQWSVGGRGGLNICKITGQRYSDYEATNFWIVGPSVFGMGSVRVTNTLSIRGELGYTIMGNEAIYQGKEGLATNNFGIKEKYHCLQGIIAVQAAFKAGKLSLFGMIGQYITNRYGGNGLYYDERSTEELEITWVDRSSYWIYSNQLVIGHKDNSSTDLGLYVGAGMGADMGNSRLELDCRFGLGLIDLHKFSDREARKAANSSGYVPFRNLNFNITLGYWFTFKKNKR